jgi:hypothetical protein
MPLADAGAPLGASLTAPGNSRNRCAPHRQRSEAKLVQLKRRTWRHLRGFALAPKRWLGGCGRGRPSVRQFTGESRKSRLCPGRMPQGDCSFAANSVLAVRSRPCVLRQRLQRQSGTGRFPAATATQRPAVATTCSIQRQSGLLPS